MTKEMETRLGELLQSESFLAKLSKCEDREAVRVLLEENNVEMTVDEISASVEAGKLALVEEGYITNDEELTEKALETVSGGIDIMAYYVEKMAELAKCSYIARKIFGKYLKMYELTHKTKKKRW